MVTIIVLLILAAIAINLTIGENGILKRAQEAVELYNNKVKEEQEMMNDVFKTKWAKVYMENGLLISIDTNGDLYYINHLDKYDLTNKKITIISANYWYSEDTKMYYGYDTNINFVSNSKKLKKAVAYTNVLVGISDDNHLKIYKGYDLLEYNIENTSPEFSELFELTFSDIKITNAGILLTTTEGKNYLIYLLDELINLEEVWPEMQGINIKDIAYTKDELIEVITEDGKLITLDESVNILDFNEKIVEKIGNIIKTETGNYYVLITNEENGVILKRIDEVIPEFKDMQIDKICPSGIFITNDGNAWMLDGTDIVNVKDYAVVLKDKNIKDAIIIEDFPIFLTEDGELYTLDKKLIANNIESIKLCSDCVVVKDKDGYEGYIIDNEGSVLYPNKDNIEHKLEANIQNVKTIENNYLLTENGEIYELNVNRNTRELKVDRIDSSIFEGRKIIFMSNYYKLLLIDDKHNIWKRNQNNEYENVTEDFQEFKDKNIVQIYGDLAISEDGKLCINNTEISEEEKAKLEDKIITQIYQNWIIDSDGNVYLYDEYSYDGENIKKVEELDGIKVKEIKNEGKLILDKEGRLYTFLNDELQCMTEDENSEIYNKKIISFATEYELTVCIDDKGDRYAIGRVVRSE